MLVLARPFQPNVHFIREAHPSSLDVLDRHTILHVGYRVTPCGKWLLATCTDEWGEAHDLKAWLIPDDADESFTVTSVWNFTYAFAAKANIEWRVVISKLGPLSEKELDTWIDHLDGALLQHCAQPLQIFILSVEMDNSWMFLAPSIALDDLRPTSPNRIIRHPPGTILCDMSSSTYSLSQIPPLPVYHRHFECSNLEKFINAEERTKVLKTHS
ncbi:hypothetical protein QCA50_007750 [Cerrena zonata]|uniref:Mediator of RNA polymerase II transcription subunit 13 n=1 Tax=Cerrena zonata TaxID=2478898 RepID=A0AAW0GCJ5_9APHY